MKCAVVQCKQNDGKKTNVSFYSFPKNNEQQKMLWIKFCNRVDTIKIKREKICSLHFKQGDFERNLQYEMGFSNRATLKLKRGAVPTVEAIAIANETETLSYEEQMEKTNIDTRVDSLQLYIKELEVEMYVSHLISKRVLNRKFQKRNTLRHENEMLKIEKCRSETTAKRLSQRVQRLSFSKANLEKSLRRMFTEGQIKNIKNGGKRQNFTEEDIAESITLYYTSAKAYRLLKRKNFPLPSVRTLQRWAQKFYVSTDILKPVVKLLSTAKDQQHRSSVF